MTRLIGANGMLRDQYRQLIMPHSDPLSLDYSSAYTMTTQYTDYIKDSGHDLSSQLRSLLNGKTQPVLSIGAPRAMASA